MMQRDAREAGMVTAETAVLAPVVALALALGAWIISLAHLQVRLIDAARDAARLVARGESPAEAVGEIRGTLPGDARFRVQHTDGGYVTVQVSARSRAPLNGLTWRLSASSTCVDES
jgi:hypothetical protein